MIDGWYYLHTNGDLIYKRELGETVADLRESDFVRHIWPCDVTDREMAWNIIVESLALGANPSRVIELAHKWNCDDTDIDIYADHIGCVLEKDGDQWCAKRRDFVDLQSSPAAFGNTKLDAMWGLCKGLGFRPSKMWGAKFSDLLKIDTVPASPI